MKKIEISATKRTDLGKKATRNLRKSGDVPCVLYGGDEIVHFHTFKNNFLKLVYTHEVYIVELDISGKKHKAAMQDIQFHPVSDEILHIDFVEVFDDRPVVINIPVELKGNSIGIKNGGKPRLKRRTLKVKGLPAFLPDRLEVDITKVNIGDVVKVGDLSYPNLELLDPTRSMVFSVASSRVAVKGGPAEGEEEEGAEEGAAEATAEGNAEA